MSKENIIQGIISVVVAGVSAYFQIIAVPIIVLIAVMILDYVTGIMSAYVNRNLSSKLGVKGIIKKIGYLIAVCVGITIDYIIASGLAGVGITTDKTMVVGLLVTVWLIVNELISILENLDRIGVTLPKFLTKLVDRLKSATDKNDI